MQGRRVGRAGAAGLAAPGLAEGDGAGQGEADLAEGRSDRCPAAPRLALGRCRSSFICDHLAAGTPLRKLLAITGICQAESLARYAHHVDGAPPKAVLRAWDRRQQAR